jgi:hypothetical protein
MERKKRQRLLNLDDPITKDFVHRKSTDNAKNSSVLPGSGNKK